jgi:nucleotide-binding universal stress UspA family protein
MTREDSMANIQHLLVPTDFGDASNRALELALALAAKLDGRITLLHATTLPPFYYAAYAEGLSWPTDELEGQARKELDTLVTRTRERHAKVEGQLMAGEPWESILEAATELRADLIVMGTHGRRGLPRALLGSVAEKTVRLSPIPVLTVSASGEGAAT